MATTMEMIKSDRAAPFNDVKVTPCKRNIYIPKVILPKKEKMSRKWRQLQILWSLPDDSSKQSRAKGTLVWLESVRCEQERSEDKISKILKATVGNKSFAQVARVNASPSMAFTIFPDHPWEILTKEEACQFASDIYKRFEDERKAARELCEAIAQRYAVKKRVKPRKVATKIKTCNWPQGLYNPGNPRLPSPSGYGKHGDFKVKQVKVPFTTPRVIKVRQIRPLDYSNVGPRKTTRFLELPKIPKTIRHCALVDSLLKTKVGTALAEGITRVRIARYGLERLVNVVRPEMDTEGYQNIDQRGNTVLSEHIVDKSEGPKGNKGFVSESVPTEKITTTTERWIPIDTITWSSSQKFNEIIWQSKQPLDMIFKNQDNISVQPILTHRYVRTGIKFKFQVNSNKFQVGQLVASWLYTDEDKKLGDGSYAHVGSCIQRNHVRLLAGSSNDGELSVPFHYPKSVMRTNKADLVMGCVSLHVLNPLVVTSTVSASCHITVLACFDDIECFGSIARSIVVNDIKEGEFHRQSNFVVPEMDTIGSLIGAGTNLVRVLSQDANRDNPPISLQPGTLIPQSIPSFCYMKGVGEPVNMMRADPTGQTPHVNKTDEMSIESVVRKWGYIKTESWSVLKGYDTTLLSLPVNPLNSMDSYPVIEKGGVKLTTTQYTPLAVISSMFGEWRGDLEFKFEIVASSFHTGRLLVGMIPGGRDDPSIDLLKSSAYETFDIGSSTELIFKAPWYFWNAWGSTRTISSGNRGNWFSSLHVKVMVPLIAIDSVPPEVAINVYVRAGDNFELALPRPSTLSVPWGKVFKPPANEYLVPYNKENRVYTTWERNIGAGGDKYALTFYVQNVSDGWCGFLDADLDSYYELTGLHSGRKVRIQAKDNGVSFYAIYGVADPDLKNSNAQGLILFRTKERAIAYVTGYHKGEPLESLRAKHAVIWSEDGAWSEVQDKEGKNWIPAPNDGDYLLWERRIVKSVRPEMDKVSIEEPSTMTKYGLTTFGEKISDLKDICRRWIPYTSISATTCTQKYPKDCPYTARFGIHPLRILSDTASSSFDNRAREGVISLIGSGYYLWRGSMRFRFVFSGAAPAGTVLYVQHRFDDDCDYDTSGVQYSTGVYTVEDLLTTSYATSVQCLDVNPSLTVEVPYYSANEALHCNPSVNENCFANGRLYVWIHTPEEIKVDLEVYYSFADDCRFSVWQGFPGLYTLSEITSEPRPQMNTGFPDGFFDFFKPATFAKIENAVDKVNDASDQFTTTLRDVSSVCNTMLAKMNVGPFEFCRKLEQGDYAGMIKDLLTNNFHHLYPSLTHIVYACLVPSKVLVCFAIFNFFQSLFGMNLFSMTGISTAITKVWDYCFPSSSHQQPQGPMDDTLHAEDLISMLVNGLGTLLGAKIAISGWDMNALLKGIFVSAAVFRTSYNISNFVIDIFTLFSRIFKRCLRVIGYGKTDYSFFTGVGDGRLREWILQVSVLTSPQLRDRCFTDKSFSSRVFTLAVMGRTILLAMSRTDFYIPAKFVGELRAKVHEILTLERELMDRKCYAPIRYEPYCLFLAGDGGCGKSTAASLLAMEISKACGGNFEVYARTAGNKYFDAYTGQDTILIDDFLTMNPNSDPESYSQFLQMKSSAVFNPPYSNVEDKAKYINFMNLVVTSNTAFFNNLPGITNPEAFNRRRDTLIYMELANKNNTKVTDSYTTEQLDNFEQSNIYIPSDVFDPLHVKDIPLTMGAGVSRRKALIDYVVDQANKYHIRQSKIYQKRVHDYQEACAMKNNGESIDDILKKYIDELKKFMPDPSEWDNASFKDFDDMFFEWSKASGTSAGAEPQALFGFPEENQEKHYRKFWEKYTGTDPIKDPNWRKDHRDTQSMSLTYLAEAMVAHFETVEYGKSIDERCQEFKKEDWKIHDDVDGGVKLHDQFQRDTKITYSHYREVLARDGDPFICGMPNTCLHSRDFDAYEKKGHFFYNYFLAPAYSPQSAPVGMCAAYIKQDDGTFILDLDTGCTYFEHIQRFVFSNWATIRKDLLRAINGTGGVKAAIDLYSPLMLRSIVNMILVEEKFGAFKNQFKEFTSFGKGKFNPGEKCSAPTFEEEYKRRKKNVEGWCAFLSRKISEGVKWIFGIPISLYKMCKWSTKFPDFAKMTYKEIGYMVAPYIIFGVAITGLLSFTNILSSLKGMVMPNLHPSGDFKDIKKHASVRDKALTLLTKGNAIADVSPVSESSFDNIKKKIKRNVFFMTGITSEGRTHDVRCLGLSGHKFLVLKHYIEFFKSQYIKSILVYTPDKKLAYDCNLSDIEFTWTSEGYGVGEMPRSFPRQFVNIVKYMPSEDFDGLYPRDMQILEVTKSEDRTIVIEADDLEQNIQVFGDSTMSSWTISKGFEYAWAGRGRCGSLLLCPKLACPLVGIHTAGNGTWKGFSEKLLKETFEPAISKIEYHECINDEEPFTELEGSYDIVGKVEPEMRVFNTEDSRIVPSSIHGVFPVATEPAPLSKFDPRIEGDPLIAGVSKRTLKTEYLPDHLILEATDDLIDTMIIYNKPVRTPGVLTYAQAIEGGEMEGYRHIEFSTSEGYPWVKMRPPKESGKRWMFSLEETAAGYKVKGIHSDLYDALEYKHNLRKQGIMPKTYFSPQLKDARIPKEKVSILGKTRVFEMSPVDLTIAQRQYFLDFSASYSANRIMCENTLGINPDGPQWTELANKLQNFSPYILSADYSGYGPKLPFQVLSRAIKVIRRWYTHYGASKEDDLVRQVIGYEIMNGIHVVNDLYFTPSCGLPSGNCDTTTLNSLSNSLLIRFVFLYLAKIHEEKLASMAAFHNNVLLFHNGDDLIISVKPRIVQWFNNKTLIDAFAEFGIKMTDSRKTGEAREWDLLTDVSYLKRGFLKHPTRPGQFLAPLEQASICDTANWCHKSTNLEKESLLNSEMSCRLAYTRGPKFYNKVVAEITQAWKEKKKRFRAPLWEELDAQVWDQGEEAKFHY